MDYFVDTRNRDLDTLRISGAKGHVDFFDILSDMGIHRIVIPPLRRTDALTPRQRVTLEMDLRRTWRKALEGLGYGDRLIIHSPPSEKFLGLPKVIRDVQKRGCRVATVIFDPEQFYLPVYKRAAGLKHYLDHRLEAKLFEMSDVVVAHTEIMKDMLAERGIDRDKMICEYAWDYLRDDEEDLKTADIRIRKELPVVFCGNLAETKSGFVYHPDDDLRLDLYGPYYTGPVTDRLRYRGVYKAIELMDNIEGSFGLVWDGPSQDSCTGTYGEYLKFNIPHKVSLYLACGMPVVIWDQAALSELILKEECGFTVSSISEIRDRIESMSDEEYARMKENAIRVGMDMRHGRYIRSFINETLGLL